MLAPSVDGVAPGLDDEAACAELLRRGSKSFSLASRILPARVRRDATVLYAFCRVADDAVDDGAGDGHAAIRELEARVDRAYAGHPFDSPVDRAFARLVAAQELPRELVDALVEGFAWDVDGRRYRDLAELEAYAARVAGTVGAMMTVLMGGRERSVLARACDLGVAMQLTNIARDVGEDARNGRLYLPMDWLEGEGIDPTAFVASPRHSAPLGRVVRRLLEEASILYARADVGIEALPRDCQGSIRAASLVYAAIGREIERAGFDAVSRRAVVPTSRKLVLLIRALAPDAARRALAPDAARRALAPDAARRALTAPSSSRASSSLESGALPATQFLVDAAAREP